MFASGNAQKPRFRGGAPRPARRRESTDLLGHPHELAEVGGRYSSFEVAAFLSLTD